MKSSVAEWKKTFVDYIRHTLRFEICVGADNNVYSKLEKYEHGKEYYSYIILNVDGVLCIHKDPNKYLNLFDRDFLFKDPP